MTDGLCSDLIKLIAIVGLDLPQFEFTFLRAFLPMMVIDLIQIVVWLTWQSLP